MINSYIAGMTKAGYFPILDVLRLLASFCVLLAHSVVFFHAAPIETIHFGHIIKDAGYYGVLFFYVLSGFLITWLLLKEREDTGTIAVKKFYLRRALRIWPLYYLIVLLSFFVFSWLWPWRQVMPGWNSPLSFLLYLFFLPNIATFSGAYLPTCFHTYTIGFEEQFYLFWPLILKVIRTRLLPVLVFLFFLPPLLEILHLYIVVQPSRQEAGVVHLVRAALTFINYSNMPAFIAGALSAVLFRDPGKKVVRALGGTGWKYLWIAVIFALMYFGIPSLNGYVNLVSIVFALLILNLVQSASGSGRISGILARGGKISYGIYIFHPAVLILVSACMAKTAIGSFLPPLTMYLLYLLLSSLLVLLISAGSYRYFERAFLKRKERLI